MDGKTPGSGLTRRMALAGLVTAALAGCRGAHSGYYGLSQDSPWWPVYGPVRDEPYTVPAADLSRLEPRFYRQQVAYETGERPGTIVVDTGAKHLHLVQENGHALRYGIGVGREGFGWSGRAVVGRKQRWPTWTPPPEMIAREPELEQFADGMAPGLENPLGARALYLYQGGRDTLYRLHGTGQAYTIGQAVSSGCIRLLNQDIIDLYGRVAIGTEVVVTGSRSFA